MNRREEQELEKKAIEWVIKHDSGMTADEQDAFLEWLANSNKNKIAFRNCSWGWGELDRLAGMESSILPIDPDLLVRKTHHHPSFFKTGIRFLKNHLIAALFLLAMTGVFLSFFHLKTDSDPIGSKFYNRDLESAQTTPVTSHEEFSGYDRIEKIQLEDGSTMELNRGAVANWDYSGRERVVYLEKGEANFTVAKDEERPFVVDVSGVRLEALGTEFNVRIKNEKLDVIVTEGIVALKGNQISGFIDDEIPHLTENQRAIVDTHNATFDVEIEHMDKLEIDSELNWHPKLFDFENLALSEIVEEFNNRNPVTILLPNDSIKDHRLTCMFWSDDVEGFVRILDAYFEISAQWVSEDEIVLFERNGG